MNQDPAIACSLSAADLQSRLDEMTALGQDALIRTDPDGTMRFRPDPATRERLEAVLEAESHCCSFLDFDLREDGDSLRLSVAAPEGAKLVAEDITAAFTAKGEAA